MLIIGITLEVMMNRLNSQRLDVSSTRKLLDSSSLLSYERRRKVTVEECPTEVIQVAIGFKYCGCTDVRTKDACSVGRLEVS